MCRSILLAPQSLGAGNPRGELFDPHILTSEKFDAIILAVGFGIEKTVNDLRSNSYWRVDLLTQTALESQDDNYVVLVSGVGDGGTIDVLRAKLREPGFRSEAQRA